MNFVLNIYMKRLFLIILPLFLLGIFCANAQTVSNVHSTFSCPGEVTITYDLNTPAPVGITVYYSTDNGQTYHPCATVSGNLRNQSTGSGKNVIWDLKADGFRTGFFVFKVEPECVMINGLCWATRNVDKPGTFVDNPEDAGMFYQWNRNIGWSATDPMINSNGGTVWDESYPTGTTWEKANDPCPSGWRVPTLDEYKKLLDREKVSYGFSNEKDIIGLRCTDKASGKSIFLPAAGFRSITNGKLYYVGDEGNYWSSTQDVYVNYYAYIISFEMDGPYPVYWHDYFRSYGNCVRCVAD